MDIAPPQWDEQQIKREASFLQSAPWGEFQAALGHRAHYLKEKDWSCLLVERRAPIGNYLFSPYGPTLARAAALPQALEALKTYGKDRNFDWLRLEPLVEWGGGSQTKPLLREAGAVRAPHDAEPPLTRVLDLNPSLDELLAGISSTTRGFVRKNQREQLISFKTSTDPANVADFSKMVAAVASRKKVGFFNDEYYQKQAEFLMPAKMLYLELALAGGQPIAGIIMHDFGQNTSYTHAASLPAARDRNASALLLWQAIVNAKQRGMARLDLYGVAPENAPPNHPWYGFSAFKRKFGGQIVERAGTWDIPLTAKYRLYRSAQRASVLFSRR